MSLETIIGFKITTAIAAFGGAVVSLGMVRGISFGQAVTAIIGGTLSAIYIAPMLTGYFDLAPQYANGVVFLTGVLGMNILGGWLNYLRNSKTTLLKQLMKLEAEIQEKIRWVV